MDGSARQLIVVALPSEDDRVHKVSTEKEPHLTLLYLSKNEFDPSQLALVTDYVEHAASFLSPFVLDVESRGELGDKKADVLFFSKRWTEEIKQFRGKLLQHDLISTAYQSTEQFPEWVPHLTMGFPNAPAKKDERFWCVSFDRIALWTDDSAGPTFQLKPKDLSVEVSMSQTTRDRASLDGLLMHYGIKGMKWGVRRANPSEGSSTPSSDDAKAAEATRAKIKSGGTKSLSNKELQEFLTRMDLERRYNASKPPTVKDEAIKFVKETLVSIGKQEAAKYATKQVAKALAARS